MRNEKLITGLQAAALAFLLSFGALGAMITALRLNTESMLRLALLCAGASLLTALLSSLRFGGWALAAALLFSALYFWRNEESMAQAADMLCRVSRYYDNAYGWGVISSDTRGMGPMDRPLALLALWLSVTGCRSLCANRAGLAGLLVSALPLAACVVVTDTVPAPLYLYLWLLGLVLVLLSRSFRRQQPRWGVNAALLAAVPAALALALLFWAVPREGYDKHPDELQERVVQWFQELPDLWNQVSEEVVSYADGFVQPQTISLDTLGPRIDRVYPVMEVTAPVSGTVYLRGQHYDTYTGTGWEASEVREPLESPEITRELGTITISTRRARDVIYLPYYPAGDVTLSGGSLDNSDSEKTYSFTQLGLYSHWRNVLESLAAAQDLPPLHDAGHLRYLDLPADTRAWATELTDRILRDETTATAAAEAIAQYVRGSALYDLDTRRMSREYGDFAQWFLEESDTGYCVHFATATVVLLRAAGVEARYVEGYMFTAVMGEETTVTADQAHAWAEYYEPLLDAWIALESTPGDLGGQDQTQPDPPQTEATLPTETEVPSSSATSPDTAPEGPDREEESDTPEFPGEPAQKADLRWLRTLLLWLAAPVLTLAAAESQRRLRLERRSRRQKQGPLRKRGLAVWRELEKLHRLLKTAAPEEARVLAEKAKYSRQGISEEELRTLNGFLRDARQLMNGRSWYLKILDRYIFAVC